MHASIWRRSVAAAASTQQLPGPQLTPAPRAPGRVSCPQSAQALSFDDLQGLTYLQVKGSGIANTCPTLDSGSSNVKDLKPGTYSMGKFCMEPTSFTVKEESQVRAGGHAWPEGASRRAAPRSGQERAAAGAAGQSTAGQGHARHQRR